MDPGDLLFFDAIVREGGVSSAAARLGVPKTTISRRLRRLEKDVGAPLFDRTGRRLRLTETGRAFAGSAASVRLAIAEAQSVAAAARSGQQGTLRISAPYLFGRLVIAPMASDFLAVRPGVRAHLRFDNLPIDPMREDLDIAIRVEPPTEEHLVYSRLAEARCGLYAVPRLARLIREPSDLEGHGAIATANHHSAETTWLLSGTAGETEVRAANFCTVNDPEAAASIAEAGIGIAALPHFIAEPRVAAGILAPVLAGHSTTPIGIFAILPPRRSSVPLVRDFLAALKQHLAASRFARTGTARED
jgi:LysR family transcriptional regulator for bpeEF and oprC